MRKKIFIIHGKAIGLQESIAMTMELLYTKIHFHGGKYYVPKNLGRFLRYVIYESHNENLFLAQLEHLMITRLVISAFYLDQTFSPTEDWISLSDLMVEKKINGYDIKKSEKERKEFCEKEFKSTCESFAKLICCGEFSLEGIYSYLKYFHDMIGNNADGKYLESDITAVLYNTLKENGGNADAFVNGLKEIVRNAETGGDLDTIGSNALYGYWAINSIPEETGAAAVYGRDFEFDFMNYHEGMKHLNVKHRDCDIYVPDFPIDAIPELKNDVAALMECGNYVVRFDDHHPLSPPSKEALDDLKNSGKIGQFVMSGYIEGMPEIPKEFQKCGTDLIYDGLIKNTKLDSPLWKEFTRLAHVQDLHIVEDKMAIDLSKLIGSKHSKLDMVQKLMQMQKLEDLQNILQTTGWDKEIKAYEDELNEQCPKLEDAMAMIEYNVPLTSEIRNDYYNKLPGSQKTLIKIVKALTFGFVDLTGVYIKEIKHSILLVLAPYQSSKEARINVASVIHYFKDKFHFDYLFFCYGMSLITTRKINEEDKSLDLNEVAGKIGGPDDGGHSEAATFQPAMNPKFPKTKITKVNAYNFSEYVKYLAMRIQTEFGYRIIRADKMPKKFYLEKK